MWVELERRLARGLDARARRRAARSRGAEGAAATEHLVTGERGELEALFYLRKAGYTVVARRWKTLRLAGDIDLIGWEGRTLCFVEVKTRAARDWADAVTAVDEDKREMLRRMAKAYLRRFPERRVEEIEVRFDVVSVYLLRSGVEFELYRGAFGW